MRRHWDRRGVSPTLWGSCLLVLGSAACGDDEGATLACGKGTEQQAGECVPVDSGMPYQGDKDAGSKDSGPETQVDAGGQHDAGHVAAISCGEGTIKVNGKCVVNPASALTCGDGTTPVNGKCEVEPPPPVQLSEMVISQLSIRNRGQLVSDGGKIHQFYPVQVSVGLTYKGDAAKVPVVFALGEPPDPNKTAEEQPDLGFCLVGGFHIDHPGGANATESIASATLNIPKGCLPSGKSTLKVSPIVMIDPDLTLDVTDHDALSRMVVFAKENDVDPDMAACRIDASEGSTKGTCQVEADVEASPGIDFELADLTAETSVVVLDKCADGTDMDRPESYRCNSSIVPEFKIVRDGDGKPVLDSLGNQQIVLDVDGKPEQATYVAENLDVLPKWVYGPADLDLDVTVMAYGADDSKLDSVDDTDGLSPTDNTMAVNNVLAEHGLQIKYEIRSADSTPVPGDMGMPTVWHPLYMHKQGEQAKADEAGESGQTQEQFEETKVVPATPHYYSHGLYVENDCGERNGDTCNDDINPRSDVISGDWAGLTDFVVRACLVPVDDNGDEDAEFDDNPDNNCREIPIKIVRHDTSGSTIAASYGFNFQWGDGAGSQTTLRLGWGLHSWNKVDITGATADNEAAVTLGSDLVGYADILKVWAKGAAYVALTGSFYDYGIGTFGVKLFGDAKSIPSAYHWGYDWNVSKELRRGTIVWAGAVPIQLEIRFGGIAGIAIDLDVLAATTPLAGSEESEVFLRSKTSALARIGLAQLAVTPYGQMTVTASAAITAGVVRVGVAADLTLVNMRTPLTGRLWWGTNLSPLIVKAGAWADLKLNLNVMSGEVYLFAENQSLAWCTKRVKVGWVKVKVSYPCGLQWNTFWDLEIADWDGWTWNQTLWTSPYVEYTLQ